MTSENKTVLPEEVKRFKEGLENIRREESLALEMLSKAELEAKEIIKQGNKKKEELIEKKKIEAQKEGQLFLQKVNEESLGKAEGIKNKGQEEIGKLARRAKANTKEAVEFIVKKIME